eukprot:4757529-Prymnesium_polylepis.2
MSSTRYHVSDPAPLKVDTAHRPPPRLRRAAAASSRPAIDAPVPTPPPPSMPPREHAVCAPRVQFYQIQRPPARSFSTLAF